MLMKAAKPKGRLSINAPTMVSTASTAAGMSSGKRLSKVSSTCVKRSTTVESKVGSKSPIACSIPLRAGGKAFTIFSMIGTMFFTTCWNDSTTLPTNISMSASALPSPAMRFPIADCIPDIEPLIVSVASLAVVPVMPISVWITWMASVKSENEERSYSMPEIFSASARSRSISDLVPP